MCEDIKVGSVVIFDPSILSVPQTLFETLLRQYLNPDIDYIVNDIYERFYSIAGLPGLIFPMEIFRKKYIPLKEYQIEMRKIYKLK